MSLCSSFEDCSEDLIHIHQSKKKWRKRKGIRPIKLKDKTFLKVVSTKRDYLKTPENPKPLRKYPKRSSLKKKLSTKVRDTERIKKSEQSDFRADNEEESVLSDRSTLNTNFEMLMINANDNLSDNLHVPTSYPSCTLQSSINSALEDPSVDSDDSDIFERPKYIKLLSKLIDLNMPSKIESNRSNEAYSKRQCFLEKRRSNPEKIECCQYLFCSESFWIELQHRVKSRKDDHIKRMKEKMVSVLRDLAVFKITDCDTLRNELPKDKTYTISKSYLSKIKCAYEQVSDLLGKYYYYLSFWPTSGALQKAVSENNIGNLRDQYQQITDIIDTMQAWQNCCQWLNWKTHQICQFVGISGSSLNDFIIIGSHGAHCSIIHESVTCIENCFDDINSNYNLKTEEKYQSQIKSRVRSHSLNMSMDYRNQTSLVISESSNEISTCIDYESKFEIYADINRRRYGLEKVCCSAIDCVQAMIIKYQNLFSITKDENTLPLMHSYAEALKDNNYWPPINNQNGSQLIFTENLNEANYSSYQANKPSFEDSAEFPMIQAQNSLNFTGISSMSLSSNQPMSQIHNENNPDPSDDNIQMKFDILKKRFEQEQKNYNKENDNFRESKGLFGMKNHVAARLALPPLLPHYLFLARFPIKIMHCCIRRLLSSADISKISELSVLTIKQRIIDYKDALQYTMQAREFLSKCTFGINFQINKYLASNSKDFAPKQDIDLSDFMSLSMKEIDGDLSSLLRLYIDCLKELLKKWSKSSSSFKFEYGEPRKLLEEEWNFVKTYCHSIKQEEEIVASSFCNLAEYLFDLLRSRIESEDKLNIEVDNTPNDSPTLSNAEEDNYSVSSNRRLSKNCQIYNNKCKMIQSQLKQAADFAKMLRGDLEISMQLELNINYSMNELLSFLSLTRHKMLDLCSMNDQSTVNQTDLTLIIPEESSSFVKELLDPLITGFSFQPKTDNLRANLLNSSLTKSQRTFSREYILIINKKAKINWPGEKVKFIYQLDICNLKQRIESSNIVFLARRPDELTEQLSSLLDFKIPPKSLNIQFKNVIQSCSDGQAEACHYNSKRTLNALKSKAIEVSSTLHHLFIYEEKEVFTGSELNKIQEETLRNTLKNSYSITFEFYRDLIKLCTGNAFKTILKNTIISLLEKWFRFSRRFEPSEKGTVPRWANDGLNFLLQICQSRVVMNMTKKEWHDFKKSMDNFVEFIVGKSNRQNSNTSGKSVTNSSKVVTGRSWQVTPKTDIIHGCEPNSSNTNKIENWVTNCENRVLRTAFSEPKRMVDSDQNIFSNSKDPHIDMKTIANFTEISSYTRSITMNDSYNGHYYDGSNSNKSTDGSSNADYKERKRVTLKQAIDELERQLNEKRRQHNLMGFVRDSNSQSTSSGYIKKAPFQWIKKGSIGQGHAGTVYKVCNLDSMEIMAMKEIVINEPFSQDLIECDLLCKLNNPSLLKYYGVDISLSHIRIFTEYCESGSLSQVSILDIPEKNLRQWTKQILEAIMHLHSHRFVHRDVKPDNIFLKNIENTNECHAKLGDFGVAKCLDNHQNGLRDIQGTVMYMAPEVVTVDSEQNKSKAGYNHKVDIWSLGCTLLYMITGKQPWDENHELTIYYNLGLKKIPLIPEVDSTVRMTKEARDFIMDCLCVNPEDRPETIDLLNYNFVKLRNP